MALRVFERQALLRSEERARAPLRELRDLLERDTAASKRAVFTSTQNGSDC
jgi:hypothetical protein